MNIKYLLLTSIIFVIFGCDKNAERNQAFIKGRDALKEKKYELAKVQLEITVSHDSNFSDAWNNLGIAYYELEKYSEAQAAYEKALFLDSCLEDTYQNYANLIYKLGDIDHSIVILSDGLICNPKNKSLLLNRATLFQQKKQFTNALDDLQEYQKIVIKDDVLYTNLGYCFFELNELDSAFHYSLEALEINPKRDEAVNNLGMISQKNGKDQDALKFFEDAVKLKPQNVLYRKNVAQAALKLNKNDIALKNAKMAAYYSNSHNYDTLSLKAASEILTIIELANFMEEINSEAQSGNYNYLLKSLDERDKMGKFCDLIFEGKKRKIKIDNVFLSKCK